MTICMSGKIEHRHTLINALNAAEGRIFLSAEGKMSAGNRQGLMPHARL